MKQQSNTTTPEQPVDSGILREWLLSMLPHSTATITFKKVDGSTRVMNCTLKKELLPPAVIKESTQPSRPPNTKIISVWDLDVGNWRSFIVANVTRIQVTMSNETIIKEINNV